MAREPGGSPLFDTRPLGANGEGPAATAAETVLAALEARGGLEPTDAATVAAVRILADAIDNDCRRPGITAYTLARSTRQLVELLEALGARSRPAPDPAADVDPFAALAASLSAPASHGS